MKSRNFLTKNLNLGRKNLAMLTAALLLSCAALPYAVQAGTAKQDSEKYASRIAENFKLDKAAIQQYCQKGVKPMDIRQAAILSQISGKSFDEVLAKKTSANTWQDVATSLGVSKEQMKAARQKLMAQNMHKKLNLDEAAVQNLLQQGYHPRHCHGRPNGSELRQIT